MATGERALDGSGAADRLLLPGEVAALFGVEGATVSRWVREERLPAVRTLGGHHRFRRSDVEALLVEHDHRPALRPKPPRAARPGR